MATNLHIQVYDSGTAEEGTVPSVVAAESAGVSFDGAGVFDILDAARTDNDVEQWVSRGVSETLLSLTSYPPLTWNPCFFSTESLILDTCFDIATGGSQPGTHIVCRQEGIYNLSALFQGTVAIAGVPSPVLPHLSDVQLVYTVKRHTSPKSVYSSHEADNPSLVYIPLGYQHNPLYLVTPPSTFNTLHMKYISISGNDLVPLYAGDEIRLWWQHNAVDAADLLTDISFDRLYVRVTMFRITNTFKALV